MLFLLEYPVEPAEEEGAIYAHPSPHPLYAPNCPKLPAVFSNLSTKYQIFVVENNFQLYLHFKSYLLYKLGEIRGDRNRQN